MTEIPAAKRSRRSRAEHAALGTVVVSCLVALVVLSWLPKDHEVRTGYSGQFEHVLAYAGSAMLLALFLGGARRPWALLLVPFAACLEIGQLWASGRTAQLIDFAASSVGVVAGFGVALLLARLSRGSDGAGPLNRGA